MKSFISISPGHIVVLLISISIVYGIWPPPYSVHLSHEETFEISELLDSSDVQDVYDEEEMIKKEDMLERQNMSTNKDKYFRIHQQVRRYSNDVKDSGYNKNKTKMFNEFNPDMEESIPWRAGFVDDNGNFRQDEDIIYFDGEPQTNFNGIKLKRSEQEEDNKNDSVNYDYKNFKAEYDKELKSAENANDTLKYSTVKEDESLKDSIKTMVDFKKTPRNCTAEEVKGIGLGAVECFWMEAMQPKMKSRVIEKVIRVVLIWIFLYILVAIPCWCQYGYCCCCCRCKFCRPRENIAEIQKFFANNPVGTYQDEEGKVYNYKPTGFERYAYKKLEQELNKL